MGAALLSVLFWFFLVGGVGALPVQYMIPHHGEECLYEKVDKGESFTISAFILAGSKLQAHIAVDGPVAPAQADTARKILESVNRYDEGETYGDPIKFTFDTNFEDLNMMDDDDNFFQDDDDNTPDEAKEGETAEESRARRAKERRKILEARQREERMKHTQKKRIRAAGTPMQRTFKARADGWYQLCVDARYSAVTIELDFRKETDYGGVSEHGHVFTLEEKAVEDEEKSMEADTAAEEGFVKDEDFQSTRDKLKTLRRLLADIQSKQTQERHRLMVHTATNEHSHSRMVLSSLLETVLFMVVTGFQVFTIRRWFSGAPTLGR